MEQILTYKQAMEYMESVSGRGSVLGLESIRMLCGKLGNPQDALRFIHIAGTNGKGSTLAYISAILKQAGYRVGRYISPTIFHYRERFQIQEKAILAKEFCEILTVVKEKADEMAAQGFPYPTAFEIETAVGFLYFKSKSCDVVLLETGMGGDMDATNVISTAEVCVFASISMDHMAILGKTLGEIAEKKAGIMKTGCKCVSVWQKEEAKNVLCNYAQTVGAELHFADENQLSKVKYGLEKQKFSYGSYKNVEIRLAGVRQIENAVLALETILCLKRSGSYQITEAHIRKGFLAAKWRGRFEILSKRPYFIMDGAHNEDAAKGLAESVRFYFTNRKIIYIMGVLKDKEYEKILAETYAYAEHIITITPNSERALPAHDLAMAAKEYHPHITEAASLEEAVEIAGLLAKKEDVILAFGSLSFLGKLEQILKKQKEKKQKKR